MTTPPGDQVQPNVPGILSVCALVFGAALLFVDHNAAGAGSTALFLWLGLGSLAVAVVLAGFAALQHRAHD